MAQNVLAHTTLTLTEHLVLIKFSSERSQCPALASVSCQAVHCAVNHPFCAIKFNLIPLSSLAPQTDTIKVLWSYGDRDPVHGDFKGHGPHNRGVRTLHLMEPMFKKPSHARDLRQWDVTVRNVSIQSGH